MVWRIHFSEDDVARIQVSPTLGPLAETVLAAALLRCPQQPRILSSEWRGQVRVTPQMRPLTALLPPGCHGVDLPTLTGERPTIELGLPFWPRIRACLHAEQATRRRTLAREGPGALLASLQGPRIRWRPPVLEILRPGHGEMELGGRGIALVPSVFVGKEPSLHENPNDVDEVPRLVL